MKVILLEDVAKLGKAGEVKEVSNGYGFNFLLPEGLAQLATPQAVAQAKKLVEARRNELEQLTAELKAAALQVSGKKIALKKKTEKNKLFGSVSAHEIVRELEKIGVSVDSKAIVIDKPMKEIGTFPVVVNLGHGVKASFEIVVEAE